MSRTWATATIQMESFYNIIWVFITAGLLAGLITSAGLFLRTRRFGLRAQAFALLSAFIFACFGSWYVTNRLIFPSVVRNAVVGFPEIRGITSGETAAADPDLDALLVQSHTFRVKPGRTDAPLTVEYTWLPPSGALEPLPSEVASFLSVVGPKDTHEAGVPSCPNNLPSQRVDEVGSCARRSPPHRSYTFTWNVFVNDAVELRLAVRLGAAAIDGKFKMGYCRDGSCIDSGEQGFSVRFWGRHLDRV